MVPLNLVYVFLGGGLGAVLRYAVSLCDIGGHKFISTFAVNLIGSFLIGVLWGFLNSFGSARNWSLFAITGLLGGFTTFSSFAPETVTLTSGGKVAMACVYALLSLAGGMAFCFIGLWITNTLRQLI